ncbi:MAG: PspC domain-containing protein [Chloroflexota bacterium]|nr:PspC domain-containing protein [Chloroflexota bacterium]
MGTEFAPTPPSPSPPYVPTPSGPPRPRRLARSSRERMWAGVAGGMAEYFDLDPALVRLLWVAAAVVSGGLAVPVYILAWIILPRDDRVSDAGPHAWRDWSQGFHDETQRLADEARRVADDVRGTSQSWRAPGPTGPTGSDAVGDRPSEASAPGSYSTSAAEQAWWSERDVERHPHRGPHPRSTGIVLVALGVLLLAANSGLFRLVDWHLMWPVIFIGLGIILLARQSRWGR